ncbi:MAG: hypothetical protein Aurels2KO_31310 [Aureliella sp.]
MCFSARRTTKLGVATGGSATTMLAARQEIKMRAAVNFMVVFANALSHIPEVTYSPFQQNRKVDGTLVESSEQLV